ncbi:hypothetical protein ACIBQ1_09650 [Nonomuraea sp. NPDC050153]|uniref:hypothetical protein n=1 Tax=Nonomuraea sp. NPDC050153 TaxID=3364359 RepID=UPI00379A9E68
MSDTKTLVTPLEASIAFLRERIDQARDEMATNPYWEGGTFQQGIDNACGGAAGQLAAVFSPELADLVVDLLEELQRQQDMPPCSDPTGVCNSCEWRPDFVIADALAAVVNGSAS